MNLLDFLEKYNGFTSSEQVVANYILKNTENALHESIYDLAKKTNSSSATVVRFCKKCGYEGYKEFKIVLARDFELALNSVHSIDVNIPFIASDTDLMISKKIAQLTSESVMATQRLLTTQKLNQAVKLINNADNFFGIGVSDPYIRLQDFRIKLLRINIYLKTMDLQAEQYHLAKNTTKNDVAIIVSKSGRTAEIVNDAKAFYQNKTPIIGITQDQDSPLAKFSTVLLQLPKQEDGRFQVSNFSSQLAIEYILNVLYSCVFNSNFEHNFSENKKTPVSHFGF